MYRKNYPAVMSTDEKSFDIPNTPYGSFKNIPYIGEFNDYAEMDKFADEMRDTYAKTGYVCRVEHNKSNEFVFFYPVGLASKDEYIII